MMHAPANEDPRNLLLTTFMLEGKPHGLPASTVREIVRVGDLTPVHDAPDFIVGVVNLRGRIVTVLDLATRLGLGKCTPGEDTRIIIVEWSGEYLGLVVDRVIDVLPIDPASIIATPPNVSEDFGRFLSGVITHSTGLIPILDASLVLDDEMRGAETSSARQAWSAT
jgi:purine-binding chemotaxis protein CheW